MEFRFDPATLNMLHTYGWTPDRQVSISEYVHHFADTQQVTSPLVFDILQSFGGLHLRGIIIDPLHAYSVLGEKIIRHDERLIGKPLCLIGWLGKGQSSLYITSSGEVYSAWSNIVHLWGATIEEAFDNILVHRRFTVIPTAPLPLPTKPRPLTSDLLEHLRQIPIDALGVSDQALAVLKWHGITNILMCVVFFYHDAHDTSHEQSRLVTFMYGEVEPRMKEHGYWPLVQDADVWGLLKHQELHIGQQMVVFWQGKDQNLYDIPLEVLGLSDEAVQCIKWKVFSLHSVGDCVGHFVHNFSRNSKTRLSWEQLKDKPAADSPYKDFIRSLFEEVQPKLIELGYWRFVEDFVD